ncbi:MAG: Gfo/Idh/MocA family oxidoreductase [Ginsengibacter sp.]
MKKELNIGIVGAGGFAAFASAAFMRIPGINIIAVTDINPATANALAKSCNAETFPDLDNFLKNKKTDLVYIATPPYLHYEQSKKALLAGKHVICEKPAALKTTEAEELLALASSKQLLYVVNLMQRYNPLYGIVGTIVKQKILGDFIHGFFENYASDENLGEDHWFWDKQKSGGIFIEHGVHFFDMFTGWLGTGKIINAVQLQRMNTGKEIFDRVQATVLYPGGLVNFYHGFDQPTVLDRQEIRLQFERGEITLYEWVPVKMKLHGLFEIEQLNRLRELIRDFSMSHHTQNSGNKKSKGRFKEISYDDHITIEYGNSADKQKRYVELLTSMMNDQWSWIRDRNHVRIIDGSNAVESLRTAEAATSSAQKYLI